MPNEINSNPATAGPETEIQTIPAEFYGGAVPVPSISSAASGSTPASLISHLPAKTQLRSPKMMIFAAIAVFVLVVAGFAFYYIRQARTVKQKLTQVVALPPPEATAPAAPEEIAPTSPTSTAEEVVPPEAALSPAPSFSTIFPFKNYTKTVDTDNDGLTDEEEKIFQTQPDKPDSDTDGFIDSLEVDNLYNPIGFKPVRLADSGLIKIYSNPTYQYFIYYPTGWIPQSLDANNRDIMFTAETGEFVEVLIEENALKLPVVDWYLGQAPGVAADQLATFQTKEKVAGVKSPDGLVAYLPFEDKIFVINYNIGLKTEVNFLQTFQTMINSFRVQGEEMPPAASTSTAATSTF